MRDYKILGNQGDIKAEPFGADSNGVTWTEYSLINRPDDLPGEGDRILVREKDGLEVGTFGTGEFTHIQKPGARFFVVDDSMKGIRDRVRASIQIDKKYPLAE